MLTEYQRYKIKQILGSDCQYETCENKNLRVKGHVGYDDFNHIFSFCEINKLCFTLGEDGVLVIHS